MWTVKELIEILKKHDQDSVIAIQYGFTSGVIKNVSTLSINQDERYHSELRIKKKWRGDCPVTFLTISEEGVSIVKGQLYG